MANTATSKRPSFRWIALIAVLGGLVAWQGSIRTSTGPAAGTEFNPYNSSLPSRVTDPLLHVGTFNIHSGIGTDGKLDLVRTAQGLKGLDVIGLNEARGAGILPGRTQPQAISNQLGMKALFAPTEHRWWHDDFGNGVLSRLPVSYWMRIPLPCTQSRGFRNAVLLKVLHEGKTINVLITHLDRQADHAVHVQAITELFLSLEKPAILMGDLNTDAHDPLLKKLLSSPDVVDCIGQAMGKKTPPHIDWILVRGMKCLEADLFDNGASDHPAARATLQMAN